MKTKKVAFKSEVFYVMAQEVWWKFLFQISINSIACTRIEVDTKLLPSLHYSTKRYKSLLLYRL